MKERFVNFDELQEGDIIYNHTKDKIFFVLEILWLCKCKCKSEGYLLYVFNITENTYREKKKYYFSDFYPRIKKRRLIFRLGDK